ncbi:hypothetical protein DZD52_18305 [Xanthomonas nasturtii]|uniref:Uncharacterized protein n=1 Tax=Xanthomonas nasturtii TaxID=1843581 RepID=A0A3E1KEY4_9XANT|nr:hypothetical protein DZD52_18305 [Xanthomonas nasturtii]
MWALRGWFNRLTCSRSHACAGEPEASHVPSSGAARHLLPHEGGQCPGGRRESSLRGDWRLRTATT